MNFVSSIFFIFLPIVLILWRRIRFRWAKNALCIGGFLFYSYWYPPAVLLLVASGLTTYLTSNKIKSEPHRKRFWLFIAISAPLAILFFFKYLDLFLQAVYFVANMTSQSIPEIYLRAILPLGISFYTLRNISYAMDIYYEKMAPCEKVFDFLTYLSFFPILVAGPIARASNFLPQLRNRLPLKEEDFRFFIYRVTRGYFLKAVIADNLAQSVNNVFSKPPVNLGMAESWIGAFLFTFQIFCDFAGYTDIAIGCARLFGIRIEENFKNPYFSHSLRDFWRRWHITLTSWFRDYVYIPFGGNRNSKLRTSINIFIIFLVSGLWHGANWTFVFWGAVHGFGQIIEKLITEMSLIRKLSKIRILRFVYGLFIFVFVVFAWVPFRSPSIEYTFSYWKSMITPASESVSLATTQFGMFFLFLFLPVFLLETLKEWRIIRITQQLLYIEALSYFTLTLLMSGKRADFIYMQF